MNTPVSFELAKLLKEKGYRVLPDFKSSYPTISDVVMWLYEKHGIWISVNHSRSLLFYPYIYKNGQQIEGGEYSYDLISEAYEVAIEYTLKNLI